MNPQGECRMKTENGDAATSGSPARPKWFRRWGWMALCILAVLFLRIFREEANGMVEKIVGLFR